MTWNGEESVLEADAQFLWQLAGSRIRGGLALGRQAWNRQNAGRLKPTSSTVTTAPNIWAMGDVAGGLQFTYISLDDFRIVWSQAGEGPLYTANDRKNVPNSVFIDPPLSTVGLREKEARAQNRNIRIANAGGGSAKGAGIEGNRGLFKSGGRRGYG